jgi:hypothetical protein
MKDEGNRHFYGYGLRRTIHSKTTDGKGRRDERPRQKMKLLMIQLLFPELAGNPRQTGISAKENKGEQRRRK